VAISSFLFKDIVIVFIKIPKQPFVGFARVFFPSPMGKISPKKEH
jgi:hypothetical protein